MDRRSMKNYKRKVIYAVITMIVLVVLSWSSPVKQSIKIRQQKQYLGEEIKKLELAPERIDQVSYQINELERHIGFGGSSVYEQQDLFVQLSDIVAESDVLIREVPEWHMYVNNQLEIKTHSFKLEGRYRNLVKCIWELENKMNGFSLVSVEFYKEQDKKTKKHKLLAELYIQGIRKV